MIKHKKILAIVPGTESSAIVYMKGMDILYFGIFNNLSVMHYIKKFDIELLVIEGIEFPDITLLELIIDKSEWIGRFRQAFKGRSFKLYKNKIDDLTKSKSINEFICGNNNAGVENIRNGIIDMYSSNRDLITQPIGNKKDPGPLYGVFSHVWSAIALGLTFQKSKLYMEFCNE